LWDYFDLCLFYLKCKWVFNFFLEQCFRYILTQIFGELFCDVTIEYYVYENYFSRRWQRCMWNLCSTPSGERMQFLSDWNETSHICCVSDWSMHYRVTCPWTIGQSSIIDTSISRLLDHLKWCLVQQKAGNVKKHNIWANQKTKSCLYRWQCAHTMFDVSCFSAFVRASDFISSILF